jgi:hypothetical protein
MNFSPPGGFFASSLMNGLELGLVENAWRHLADVSIPALSQLHDNPADLDSIRAKGCDSSTQVFNHKIVKCCVALAEERHACQTTGQLVVVNAGDLPSIYFDGDLAVAIFDRDRV